MEEFKAGERIPIGKKLYIIEQGIAKVINSEFSVYFTVGDYFGIETSE